MLTNDTSLPVGADPTNAMTGQTSQTGGAVNSDFLSVLQSKLMSSSDMISSSSTGLDQALQRAIGSTSSIMSKNSERITSEFNRNAGYLNENNQNQITAARERGVGINTSDIAYKSMVSEADKQMKDLDARKNEALLANDVAGAEKINSLIYDTAKMKNQAMQQTFTNLLSMSNFGLNIAQENRAASAQSFQETSAIANIGLQYGLTIQPGESLQSVVQRAASSPAAAMKGKQAQAELAKTLAEANKLNSEANKVRNGGEYNMSNPNDLKVMEYLAVNDPSLFKQMIAKDKTLAKALPGGVNNERQKYEESTYQRLKNGESFDTITSEKTPVLDAETVMKAQLAAKDKYISELKPVESSKSLLSNDIDTILNLFKKSSYIGINK